MKLTLDRLTLSVQSDGSWLGQASVCVDGVQWSGQIVVRGRAQQALRKAVAATRRAAAATRDDESWHGTLTGYNDRKCRCEPCAEAKRKWRRDFRDDLRARGLCIDCQRPTEDGWRCEPCAAEARGARKLREIARDERMKRTA